MIVQNIEWIDKPNHMGLKLYKLYDQRSLKICVRLTKQNVTYDMGVMGSFQWPLIVQFGSFSPQPALRGRSVRLWHWQEIDHTEESIRCLQSSGPQSAMQPGLQLEDWCPKIPPPLRLLRLLIRLPKLLLRLQKLLLRPLGLFSGSSRIQDSASYT